ncbi:hypothetical protein EV421DRAFT_1658401, partial [Armillaria borealis]
MVAIELTLLTLKAAGFNSCHIILCSDNQGVVRALQAGYSRGAPQNDILQQIVTIMQDERIWLMVDWISMKDNLADKPSRG